MLPCTLHSALVTLLGGPALSTLIPVYLVSLQLATCLNIVMSPNKQVPSIHLADIMLGHVQGCT